MAGFGFDNDDFYLSGLMQEGHDNVTVISSSSDDENYDGLLEYARKLAGETSDKSSMEGGMQAGVEPGVEPGASKIPISKSVDTALILSDDMASSLSHSEQSNDVSFILSILIMSKYLKYVCNFDFFVVFAQFSHRSLLLHNVIVM